MSQNAELRNISISYIEKTGNTVTKLIITSSNSMLYKGLKLQQSSNKYVSKELLTDIYLPNRDILYEKYIQSDSVNRDTSKYLEIIDDYVTMEFDVLHCDTEIVDFVDKLQKGFKHGLWKENNDKQRVTHRLFWWRKK